MSMTMITSEVASAFQDFALKFDKVYEEAEYAHRLNVFANNLEMVNQKNAEHILTGGEAVFGITKFMDLTTEEFSATYLNYIPRDDSTRNEPENWVTKTDPATSVDWVAQGATTPVKDQGQCGSCWAFSATAAIESYAKLSGGYDLYELSPQQINSCDTVDQGCNGGNSETAYQYVVKEGGLELEENYPYTSGKDGVSGQCKVNTDKLKVSISGFTSVPQGEANLKTALADGPVSVCLAADSFQTYTGGVLNYCPGGIDHCVQAVGYDDAPANGDKAYWTIRNSWATDWGEQGFIRLAQGKDLCKVANDVTFPTFKSFPY